MAAVILAIATAALAVIGAVGAYRELPPTNRIDR